LITAIRSSEITPIEFEHRNKKYVEHLIHNRELHACISAARWTYNISDIAYLFGVGIDTDDKEKHIFPQV